MVFVSFSIGVQASDSLETELFSYFFCEQTGHDPCNPCDRSRLEDLLNPGVIILSNSLAMLVPFANFVYVVDCSELKKKFLTQEVTTQQTLWTQ